MSTVDRAGMRSLAEFIGIPLQSYRSSNPDTNDGKIDFYQDYTTTNIMGPDEPLQSSCMMRYTIFASGEVTYFTICQTLVSERERHEEPIDEMSIDRHPEYARGVRKFTKIDSIRASIMLAVLGETFDSKFLEERTEEINALKLRLSDSPQMAAKS